MLDAGRYCSHAVMSTPMVEELEARICWMRTVLFACCEKPSSGRTKPSAELIFGAHSLFLDRRLLSTPMVEKLRLFPVLEARICWMQDGIVRIL